MFTCKECNKDLSQGLILLTKSYSMYDKNYRYLHCNDCGKTYLINTSALAIEEVDYSIEGIEDDIVQSLSTVLQELAIEVPEKLLQNNENLCDCQDGCITCNCVH